MKLKDARIAYVLQDKSVFPNMTVEENLLMGGYLLRSRAGMAQRMCRRGASWGLALQTAGSC